MSRPRGYQGSGERPVPPKKGNKKHIGEESKLCIDCKNRDFDVNSSFCIKRFIDPATGNKERLSCSKARSREWACGAEGKYFEAEKEKETLKCIICKHETIKTNGHGTFICTHCQSRYFFGIISDSKAETKYREIIDKVFYDETTQIVGQDKNDNNTLSEVQNKPDLIEKAPETGILPVVKPGFWEKYNDAIEICCFDDYEWLWTEHDEEQHCFFHHRILKEDYPEFTGDWKNSKLMRPDGL